MSTVFQVRYSQLSPKAIEKEVQKRYRLENSKCEFFTSGMNDLYRIRTADETYFLRIGLANLHQKKEYEEEIAILLDLKQAGVSVVSPIGSITGEYLWEIVAPEGLRYGILFKEIKSNPAKNKQAMLTCLGKNIAKIHQRADEKQYVCSRNPIDLYALIEEPLPLLKPYLENRQEDYQFLLESSAKLKEKIQGTLEKREPFYGFCHGDLHSRNIYFEGIEPTLFDFDCMGVGYRIYDLCVYAWNESYQNEEFLTGEEWYALLKGYEQVRKLTKEEQSCVEAFLALRQLWMMGLHAKVMEHNAGCCWYNDSYFEEQIRIYRKWFNKVGEV